MKYALREAQCAEVDAIDDRGEAIPTLNPELHRLLLPAYRPCRNFSGACREMRWNPPAGHVPRGFCGATGELSEVVLVLVTAEPGDPHDQESHPADTEAAVRSTFEYAYRCYQNGKDQYHRNIRAILDLCFPDRSFDEHMRRTWMTESVLCSATKEGASVRGPVERACRVGYLDPQLDLFPSAVVAALGGKAAKRLRGRAFISAFAAAPPGCNFRGARESWEAIARAVRARAGAT